MAKLTFVYATMGAGKTLNLLNKAYNYQSQGKQVMLLTSAKDNRYGVPGLIKSRTGLSQVGIAYDEQTDIYSEFIRFKANSKNNACDVVLVDEAQFLTRQQIDWLCNIVDIADVQVVCYGIRVRYTGEPFEGSAILMSIADSIKEIDSVCHCGRKATMNALALNGVIVRSGRDIIDNQEAAAQGFAYRGLCRNHWRQGRFDEEK